MIEEKKNCKKCDEPISTKAKICPHCRTKNPHIGAKEQAKGCAIIVLVFFVLVVIGNLTGSNEESEDSQLGALSPKDHEDNALQTVSTDKLEAVANKQTSKTEISDSEESTHPIGVDIISDEYRTPHKRTIVVVLDRELSDEKFKMVSDELKARATQHTERTFINYFLTDMDLEKSSYAVTGYTPEYYLSVLGPNIQQEIQDTIITEKLQSEDNNYLKEELGLDSEIEQLQYWIMINIQMGQPWNKPILEAKLGKSEPIAVTRLNPNIIYAHYFPKADVTIFENRLKGELDFWRSGRATD